MYISIDVVIGFKFCHVYIHTHIHTFPFPSTGNMYETFVFFDNIPVRLLVSTGKKFVKIRNLGSNKRHVADVYKVAADKFILLTILICSGKTNLTIKDIVAPEGYVIVTQEKA